MSFLPKPKVAQLILAAGCSSRMGKPKQLLAWRGTTLIGHAIKQAIELDGITTYVILGAYYDTIYESIKNYPITILKNKDWQKGMGTTIQCGINTLQKKAIPYDAVLISLIDQPLLQTCHYKKLLESFYKGDHSIIATDLGEKKGVPSVISSIYFDELSKLKENFGARYLIKQYKDQVKSICAKNEGVDIDTVTDYENLIKNNYSS
ncbi:nucleotidyltransferase family protein [Aquimarina aquimarini]|uniref:nucleotidyltransferase family protein n=1 Tax=Aquimarina aquimarini TaxID=1191734 RepID=UPI000D55A877|nr:nucleotidyltransferase family protein [Aquimarina aquimarini]